MFKNSNDVVSDFFRLFLIYTPGSSLLVTSKSRMTKQPAFLYQCGVVVYTYSALSELPQTPFSNTKTQSIATLEEKVLQKKPRGLTILICREAFILKQLQPLGLGPLNSDDLSIDSAGYFVFLPMLAFFFKFQKYRQLQQN